MFLHILQEVFSEYSFIVELTTIFKAMIIYSAVEYVLKTKRLEAEEAEKKVIRIRGERNKRKLKKIMGRPMIPVGNDIVAAFG